LLRFRQIYLEITNVCNLNCSFCPGTTRPAAFMSQRLFKTLLPQAKKLAGQIYLHVLGEPLMHPEFGDFLKLAEEESVPVSVTTNGTMLDSPAAECLLNPNVRQVNISMHTLGLPAVAPRREHITQSIFEFTRQAMTVRPDLYINYRFWNRNSDADSATLEFNEIMAARIAKELDISPFDINGAGRRSRCLKGRLYVNLDVRFDWPQIGTGEGSADGFCHGLMTQLAVLADGTVVPCCLDCDGVIVLGHCPEQTLEEILKGERAVAMLEQMQQKKLSEQLCRHCSFRLRFS